MLTLFEVVDTINCSSAHGMTSRTPCPVVPVKYINLASQCYRICQVLPVVHRSMQVPKQVWSPWVHQHERMQCGRGTKNTTLPAGDDTTIWSRVEGVGWD